MRRAYEKGSKIEKRTKKSTQAEKIIFSLGRSYVIAFRKKGKKKHHPRELRRKNSVLMRHQGLEPWTNRLRVYCSTN